jgi:hypothetical protein
MNEGGGAKHQVIAASSTRFHGCRYRSLRRLRPSRRTSGVECGVWSRDRRSRSLVRDAPSGTRGGTPPDSERAHASGARDGVAGAGGIGRGVDVTDSDCGGRRRHATPPSPYRRVLRRASGADARPPGRQDRERSPATTRRSQWVPTWVVGTRSQGRQAARSGAQRSALNHCCCGVNRRGFPARP